MRLISTMVLLGAALSVCSCSSVMEPVSHQTSVSSDKALISVYYKMSIANAGPVEVFAGDVSQGQAFKRTSVQFEVEPGKHTIYALLGRNWGVMNATVEAGKRYFAYLVVFPDFLTGSKVSIDPITASEDPGKAAKAFADAKTYGIDPLKKDAWQARRKGATRKIKARHEAGNTKPSTLTSGDGI